MTSENKTRNKNLTVPNAISLARLLITPFFAYFFLNDEIVIAAILLIISGLSDMLDGVIARKLNQITELGKMLDPLADKVTQGVIALCLAIKIPEIRIILIIFIVKELIMLCGAVYLLKNKKRPTAAKWYGKTATVLFYISVIVIVAMHTFFDIKPIAFEIIANGLLIITAVFMLYSLFKYIKLFFEIVKSDDDKYDFSLPDEIRAKKEIGSNEEKSK